MSSVGIFQELSLNRSLWLVRSVCPFRNHVIFSTEFSCFLHNIIAHLRVQKIKFSEGLFRRVSPRALHWKAKCTRALLSFEVSENICIISFVKITDWLVGIECLEINLKIHRVLNKTSNLVNSRRCQSETSNRSIWKCKMPSQGMQSSDHIILCPVVGLIATGSVFTSGVWGRLASDNRKSRENSWFSNSLNVKRAGKFQ